MSAKTAKFTVPPQYIGKTLQRFAFPPSLNKRLHWAKRGRVNAAFKDFAWPLALQTGLRKLKKVKVVFTVMSIQELDTDNLYSLPKPIMDAIVQAGVVENDTPEFVRLAVKQKRVHHRADECIEVEIEDIGKGGGAA